MLARSAEDVPVLRGAERRHLVAVAVQLLQDLVAFRVQDVNLAFGGRAADAPDPYLERREGGSLRLYNAALHSWVIFKVSV